MKYGIEGRRAQFQKDSYRQPVLTQRPMNPKNYRRGQPDPETELCRTLLRELRTQNFISTIRGAGIDNYNKESMELERDCEDSEHA